MVMFCLANTCRYKSQSIRSIIVKSIQPRTFSPFFNSIVSYSDDCNPDPCCGSGGGKGRGGSKRTCQPDGRKPPRSTGGHQLCYKSYVERPIIDHDYKNMALKRPMSPHVTVVTMTTPATMSIVQRATGVILAVYVLLFSGGTLFLANGIETYVSIIQSLNLSATTVSIIKFLIGLPFAYHYFNGIRFCIWNTAMLLERKQVSMTAIAAMVGCISAAAAMACLY